MDNLWRLDFLKQPFIKLPSLFCQMVRFGRRTLLPPLRSVEVLTTQGDHSWSTRARNQPNRKTPYESV